MRNTPRTLPIIVISTALVFFGGCSGHNKSTTNDEKVVNVYNWADYIAPDTIDKFEAEYGIKVNYDMYDSAEVVDVKMLTGNSGYDVVVHSSQFSSRLAPIGIYEKLDYSRLDNMRHLDLDLLGKTDGYIKTRGYAVPYHWGTTGYAWNVEMVRQRLGDHPMDSGDVIFDPKIVSKLADCGVTLLDSATDLFPMVLAYLGRNPTAMDAENIAAAEAQLKLVRPYIRYFSSVKMMSDLPNREVCVAMSWSGDYAQAARTARAAKVDIELRYTTPKEGSGLWVDALFIPSDAPHRDNAYLFINFMLRPEIAADIANHVFYANSNASARAFTDPEILNDPAIYPSDELWEVIFPYLSAEPKQERPRTRAFARVKSGL